MLEGVRVRYARDDLRRKTKAVLEDADRGHYVQISSRVLNQGDLHILNDQKLETLLSAYDELAQRKKEESSTVRGRLSERLRHAVSLLDQIPTDKRPWGCDPTTPEGIAKTLNLPTLSSFEDLMFSRADATFETLSAFAKRYGFGEDWLLDGSGKKFPHGREVEEAKILREVIFRIAVKDLGYDPSRSKKLKLHFILFEDDYNSHIGLLVGTESFAFQRIDNPWHLQGKDGDGSGQAQQLRFFSVLKMLEAHGYAWFEVSSSVIKDKNEARAFWDGTRHPLYFVQCRERMEDWLTDFRELVEEFERSKEWCERRYNRAFFDTADFIRGHIERNEEYRKNLESFEGNWWPEIIHEELKSQKAREGGAGKSLIGVSTSDETHVEQSLQ